MDVNAPIIPTERELEALQAVVTHGSAGRAAGMLCVSIHTVRARLQRLHDRTGLRTLHQLTAYGVAVGARILALALVASSVYGGLSASADLPLDAVSRVRVVGVPLQDALTALSGEGVRLQAAREYAACKCTVLAEGRSRRQLMAALSRVYGGEWVANGGNPGTLELRRRRGVTEWLGDWVRAREAGRRAARERAAATVLSRLKTCFENVARYDDGTDRSEQGLPNYVWNLPLARFLSTLSEAQLREVARVLADSSPTRSGGDFEESVYALDLAYGDLAPAQQRHLHEWLSGRGVQAGGSPDDLIARSIRRSRVAVGAPMLGSVGIRLSLPGTHAEVEDVAGGAMAGDGLLESIVHQVIFRTLAARQTPTGALLTSQVTAGDGVVPRVSADRPEILERPPIGEAGDYLAVEFLQDAAVPSGFAVVSDYYTRSDRLPFVPQRYKTLRSCLEAAAAKFGLIYRIEDGVLTARHWYWPEREEEEPPSPLIERCLELRRKGGRLGLDEWIGLSRLTAPQRDCARAYRDPQRLLWNELRAARRGREPLGVLASLPEPLRRQASDLEGLPIARLDLVQKRLFEMVMRVSARLPGLTLRVVLEPAPEAGLPRPLREIRLEQAGVESPLVAASF